MKSGVLGRAGGGNIVLTIIGAVIGRIAKIIYAMIGIGMTLSVVGTALKEISGDMPNWVIKFGNLSMGVYLLQQFILVAIYRHTELPNIVGPYLLPWIGFVIAMISSITITFIIQKTKVGRLIIG